MATLAQIRDKADTKLAQFWDVLIAKQEAYFLKHDTFFGFNWSPSNEVEDGVDTDIGEVNRPSRKHHIADVQIPTNTKLPFQIQLMRHHGEEHGFTATVRVKLLDGRIFTRSRTAYPVVQKEVYDNTDIDNPVLVTPKAITDWNLTTTAWEELDVEPTLDPEPTPSPVQGTEEDGSPLWQKEYVLDENDNILSWEYVLDGSGEKIPLDQNGNII